MHILHLTPYYAPAYAYGGVVRSVEGMACALVRRGHAVTILTTDAFDQHNRYTGAMDTVNGGIRVVRARNLSARLRGRLNLSSPLSMRTLARDLLPQADVIHCHEFRTAENLLVTPVATRLGKSLVLSPHGTLALDTGRSGFKRAWDRLLSPALAQRFGQVIGLTDAEVEDARRLWETFGATARFSRIPNGVDLDEYANLPGREVFRQRYRLGDGPVCLFMGRLHMRKGVGVLVEAFKRANVPGAALVIAGPDEGILPILQPKLDNRIILTGYLSGAERLAALAAADVLALPAVGEGLPMVALEAMAAGLPVILSPGCNLPEVGEVGAGVVVEPRVETVEAALRDLLPDESKRRQMGHRARILVNERFTWDSVAAQLEAAYC